MPKQKPCKGLVKRIRVTKNGKLLAKPAGGRHRRTVKTAKQRRRSMRTKTLPAAAAKQVRQGLGLI